MQKHFVDNFAFTLILLMIKSISANLETEQNRLDSGELRSVNHYASMYGPFGGYFEQLDEEELPLSTQTFRIEFSNFLLNYSIINPPKCEADTNLFIFVPSRPEAQYRRQQIRESWAADLKRENATLRFVVGWPLRYEFDLLLEEFLTFSDLILYDVEDTYANLYVKVYVSFQWQQRFCRNAKFVLKTDDDAVVDVERLSWWIDHEFARKVALYPASVFGGLWRGVKVIRERTHQWHVSRALYAAKKYPPYMNGPTYLLSNKAVKEILEATGEVKALPIEDILFTGILAGRMHVHKFSVWQHFRFGKYIYVHERCRNDPQDGRKVPYVTALFGVSNPENIPRAFDELRR
uniref:Hexosyltransferase n=1 Tax=Globodera pallida TaxID=36090 RepID=A0A183BUQ6_GLOPA